MRVHQPDVSRQSTAVSTADGEIMIGRMSAGRRLGRMVMGFGVVVAAGTFAYLVFTEGLSDDAPPIGVIIAMITLGGWLGLAMIGRNLSALRARPRVTLSPRGIHGHNVWHNDMRMWFLPYHRRHEVFIPWEQFQGCEEFTSTVNGMRTTHDLVLKTSGGNVSLSETLFSTPPAALQTAILDYVDRRTTQVERKNAGWAEFQSRRWTEPLRITYWTTPWWLPVSLLVALGLAPTALRRTLGDNMAAGLTVLLGFVLVPLAIIFFRNWWRTRDQGCIELRSDGIMVAPRNGARPAIPWDDAIIRAHTHTRIESYHSSTPARLVAIEIRASDGRSIVLRKARRLRLDHILQLLLPPLDRVEQAARRIARGEPAESAATAVGLCGR